MPPPAPPGAVWLAATTQLVKVSVPELEMPPPFASPDAVRPFDAVKPEMPTVRFESIVKMRKLGVPPAALRRMVNEPAPGPLIVKSDERFGSAMARSIVPETPVRSIVSEPLLLPATHSPATAPEAALLLAAVIASRNVQKPSLLLATSAVLLTTIVAASGLISPLSESRGPVVCAS